MTIEANKRAIAAVAAGVLLTAAAMFTIAGCSRKPQVNSIQVVASLHDMTETFFVAVKRDSTPSLGGGWRS